MSKLLISTEHFGFVLSIFIFLLSVEIKAHLKSELLNPLLLSTILIIIILLIFRIPYQSWSGSLGLLPDTGYGLPCHSAL